VTTTVLVSIWVMAFTSTVFLALRLYCRISRAKSWWDDYLLIAGWVFLMNAVVLQTCIFHDGYLVTALGGPVMGPMNLGSDSSMKLSLALIKTSFALTLCGFATGWLHWVVVVVTVVTDAAYTSHAVLVWRANCGMEDSYTFEPCWPMDSGIWMNMIGSSMHFSPFPMSVLFKADCHPQSYPRLATLCCPWSQQRWSGSCRWSGARRLAWQPPWLSVYCESKVSAL